MNMENLDSLKLEIEQHIRDNGFAMFRGLERSSMDRDLSINWDTLRFPDFKEFLAVAAAAGVKIVVFHFVVLAPSHIQMLQSHLDEASIERDEKRNLSRAIQRLKMYEGFISSVAISFDHGINTYLYSLSTAWQTEMDNIAERIEPFLPDFLTGEDENDGPVGGSFYSRN